MANKLKAERLARGLTQVELWLLTKASIRRISAIERGLIEAKPEEKRRIAKALEMSASGLWPNEAEE